jgi:hypothetical protein
MTTPRFIKLAIVGMLAGIAAFTGGIWINRIPFVQHISTRALTMGCFIFCVAVMSTTQTVHWWRHHRHDHEKPTGPTTR